MGRAYEVRKASIQKNGAVKAKLYSNYAKEIYLAAKKGVPELESNVNLKHLVEKAKKEQVPMDIIKRAIDKAKGAGGEDYTEVIYEGFGPGASTFIIKTLTDNVNRTVGEIRAAFNKVHKSLGVTNSVSYNYDYLAIISFKSNEEEKIFEELLNAGIEIIDLESNDGEITITANPKDINKVKEELEKIIPGIEYTYDEVGMFAKEEVTLTGEDKEIYDKLYNLLDAIDDVSAIYTNVKLD
ncbi:probable transcriptional regulatory protein EUBDOL_01149 [Clostridium sp. CAG:533]|nr:probable transcriptional regulatory protein EUBDOL_01149 [Clostridium sp. CAG:533]